ncbi:hypothetical protein ANMWB30_23680 [Arthrobacter sp. MWB30]|nr:hypothetical protein ANMWB30_23680 [Arthrobacter sp. MWB30]
MPVQVPDRRPDQGQLSQPPVTRTAFLVGYTVMAVATAAVLLTAAWWLIRMSMN